MIVKVLTIIITLLDYRLLTYLVIFNSEREFKMIGDRVKRIRKEKNLSMTELAEKAGVAKSYLSSLERNIQVNPSIQFLEKIASVLHVPLDALLRDTPDMSSLDEDWAELVREAMNSGVSKDQFRDFIEFNKWRSNKEEE